MKFCFFLFFSFNNALHYKSASRHNYIAHEQINLTVNPMKSSIRPIPLDFFQNDVFCSNTIKNGVFSQISFRAGDDNICQQECQRKYNESQKKYLINLINNKYRAYYMLDEIPVSFVMDSSFTGKKNHLKVKRFPGVEIGYVINGEHFLNNHIDFKVEYSKTKDNKIHVVNIDIMSATNHNSQNGCDTTSKMPIEKSDTYSFTFSVRFEKTELNKKKQIEYLSSMMADEKYIKYRWISICNSFLLIFVLAMVIIFIVFKNNSSKIPKGGLIETFEDQDPIDETGWQLIHGDVFRSPAFPDRLCALIGGGFQLSIGTFGFIIVVAFGLVSPLNLQSIFGNSKIKIFFFILAAPLGGLVSSKLFHSIGDRFWKKNIVISGLVFVLPTLLIYLIFVNKIFSANESTSALSFQAASKLVFLLVFVDMLFFVVGSILGLKLPNFEFPTRVNNLPRQIPQQPFFLSPLFTMLVGGLAIFSVFFVELYFLYHSAWTNLSVYFISKFFLVVYVAMLVLSVEITIIFVYLHLIYENYHWWWAAFRIPASSGGAFFAYSVFYMVTQFKPNDFSSAIIYLAFSAIFGFAVALINGSIGFLYSQIFVQKIYGVLKME